MQTRSRSRQETETSVGGSEQPVTATAPGRQDPASDVPAQGSGRAAKTHGKRRLQALRRLCKGFATESDRIVWRRGVQ